jgi:hypothetical protein
VGRKLVRQEPWQRHLAPYVCLRRGGHHLAINIRHRAFDPNPTAKKVQVGYSKSSRLTKPQAGKT